MALELDIGTVAGLGKFMAQARCGDRVCYHRGLLVYDREDPELAGAERSRITRIAERVRKLVLAGLLRATQRREGEVCAYLGTRTSVATAVAELRCPDLLQ